LAAAAVNFCEFQGERFMSSKMRIRAKVKGGETEVKALINHPMETGQRKDAKTGNLIPAHFIQEVLCEHNGEVVMSALWSGGISKDPYLAFQFKGGAVGDSLTLSWTDNKGESDSLTVQIG
jgi:sulfur-oxidizing protein SoxZ